MRSPARELSLPGRLAFAGTKFGAASYGARYPELAFKKGFGPRIGFAYTVNDKTVVRAGYGLYFGQAFYPGWGGGLAQDGFNKNLTLTESSAGNFKTPAIYLASGISPSQVGPTQNISAGFDNGQTPSLYRPYDGNRRPYSSQWNLTVERQLPGNTLLNLAYVGTKGTHLPSALGPINVLNPLNPTITAIGSDLAVNYNDPTRSSDLRRPRCLSALRRLGRPDDGMRADDRPGSSALPAILRRPAGS